MFPLSFPTTCNPSVSQWLVSEDENLNALCWLFCGSSQVQFKVALKLCKIVHKTYRVIEMHLISI